MTKLSYRCSFCGRYIINMLKFCCTSRHQRDSFEIWKRGERGKTLGIELHKMLLYNRGSFVHLLLRSSEIRRSAG